MLEYHLFFPTKHIDGLLLSRTLSELLQERSGPNVLKKSQNCFQWRRQYEIHTTRYSKKYTNIAFQ